MAQRHTTAEQQQHRRSMIMATIAPAVLVLVLSVTPTKASTTNSTSSKPKPLQVVIMAGQSNMVGHGFAIGSDLHWDPTVPKGGCGGTVGGCVVPDPERPTNLNGSLLTPEFARYNFGTPGGASGTMPCLISMFPWDRELVRPACCCCHQRCWVSPGWSVCLWCSSIIPPVTSVLYTMLYTLVHIIT